MKIRKLYFIDLFCGAGGVTTGILQAQFRQMNIAKVIACVNHDPLAIKSHAANHKDIFHFIEDIRILDLTSLIQLVNSIRKNDTEAIICIWASAECTNYSKAKGGLPRNADSRTLPNHLFRYIESINPEYFWIENVEEFMSWGPLDQSGKPISRKNGIDYLRWVNRVQSYGYEYDFRILNCADFGAYTSRKRYFAQFVKPGYPIVWPEPTHSKTGSINLFYSLKKWKPVKDCINFSDKGKSIFRDIPLSNKTYERIYAGLIKYIAKGQNCFIAKYYSSGGELSDVDEVCSTLTTKDRISLIQTEFWIDKQFSGSQNHISIDSPAGAILVNDKHCLVGAEKGSINIPTSSNDSEIVKKIKLFMSFHNICDIKMRMLKVPELLKIQGFPNNYILEGNQTNQKKFIGNSVPPPMVKALIESSFQAIMNYTSLKTAV